MTVDLSSAPPAVHGTEPATRDQTARLALKFKHLNAKFLALQSAVLSMADLNVVPVGHPLADLVAIETDFHKDAKVTVIAVAGMALKLGMAPREFRSSMSGRPCNFIFIKDFRQAWYQHGLLGLSTGLDDTSDVLKSLLPPQTESVRLIGSSSGGFGAIQLGLRMNADKVLAFAPQTRITPNVFRQFKTVDSDMNAYDFQARDTDLRNAFADHSHYSGAIRIVFGGKNAFDTRHALRLRDQKAVSLQPLRNCPHHTVAAFARKTGALTRMLEKFTAYDPD